MRSVYKSIPSLTQLEVKSQTQAMEAFQMAAYLQLICLTTVSINTSLDPGGDSQAPAWQLTVPLLSLQHTVRNIFELMVRGRPNNPVPLLSGKDSINSTRELKPKTATKILNLAAIMAFCISLRDWESETLYMKLLVANAMCCWITGKSDIDQRRGMVQDPLQWRFQLAVDITTIFISHSTILMLMTSASSETIAVRALRCTVWFLPLAAIAIALSLMPDRDGPDGTPKIPPGFCWVQMCCWLGVAAFGGFGDLTWIIIRREPVGFGGLHPLHACTIGAHYFAAMMMVMGRGDLVGSGSWVYAGVAGLWLGLVGFNTLYVPRIHDREQSGCGCR